MTPEVRKVSEYLLGAIKKEQDNYCNSLADGRAADFAEYRFLCGRIQGLAIAEGYILDLIKRLEESDE